MISIINYIQSLFINTEVNEQQVVSQIEKTAQKWQKIKKQKDQVKDSTTAINFKTHQLAQTDVEIIIPSHYPELNKHNQILIIECGKQKVLAQVSAPNKYTINRKQIEQKSQISLLKTLIDIEGIQCGPTGMFKGEIGVLNPAKMVDYNLQIVEFLVKQTYFSRRDQYKVMKALKESLTHVYIKKTLYFDEIQVQVNAMMKNSTLIVKSGIIDKNTKIIFRTSCSKITIGIQISLQAFSLNQNKQMYLQKMIEFLYVYLQRTAFFNSSPRLSLIFFGRCFYPQFKTLQAAYDYLLKQNTSVESKQKFNVNFAVALQKDYQGRVFQDVYRRIIWTADMIDNFRQLFWQKLREFLFTINWNFKGDQANIGNFILKGFENKMARKTIQQSLKLQGREQNNLKIKPFVHKLKSVLGNSKDINLFEAISLISEQYKHHYKFRSLTQTGNTIIILSAGDSEYNVDELSYKMVKSYVYLTNIYCSLLNFKRKTSGPVKASVVVLNKKPFFQGEQAKKLQNLSLHCIEKQIYLSPTNQSMIIWDYFCNKNHIYPEEIKLVSNERSIHLKQHHHCDLDKHYELIQSVVLQNKKDYKIEEKLVSFIDVHSIDDRFFHIHQLLYDKMQIQQLNRLNMNKLKTSQSQLDIFQSDLDKILITKTEWGIQKDQNDINRKLQTYRHSLETNLNKSDKKEKTAVVDRISRAIFRLNNQVEDIFTNEMKFQTSSNNDVLHTPELRAKSRKNSQEFRSEIMVRMDSSENKGKVNIFQQTYRNKNHEYNAGQREQAKVKKYLTHNKQRLKNNYLQSNIHYIIPNFNQSTMKKLKAFIKKEYIQELKDEQQKIIFLFESQKIWKNLLFPLLTPIFTKYRQNFKQSQEHLDTGITNQTNDKRISILQDEICKLLMKNYQIEESSLSYNINNIVTKLSKGHVSCHLNMMGGINLARKYVIDPSRQKKIVPYMLYRYLCYEDKDCRFCSKYLYFEDKNYFVPNKYADLQIKTVKIVLAYVEGYNNPNYEIFSTFSGTISEGNKQISSLTSSFVSNKKDPFQQFIKMFNDKYKQFSIILSMIGQCRIPKKKRVLLNFSKKESRALYNHQEAEIQIDTQYNFKSLFEIEVSWNRCSSAIINEFVENVMTMGRRSKLKPSLLSSGNIFNTIWSITTIGQIIFESRVGIDLLQKNLNDAGQWLWDSNDYYFHMTGIAFIRVVKQKKLILWRDNNNQKRNRDIKKDDSCKQYVKFFMKAAMFDLIGGIIERVLNLSKPKKHYRHLSI